MEGDFDGGRGGDGERRGDETKSSKSSIAKEAFDASAFPLEIELAVGGLRDGVVVPIIGAVDNGVMVENGSSEPNTAKFASGIVVFVGL